MKTLELPEPTTIVHEPIKKYYRNKVTEIRMGRVCGKCGQNKDTYGGKTCSKGHFICHSCAKGHVHCPLCGHTLR